MEGTPKNKKTLKKNTPYLLTIGITRLSVPASLEAYKTFT
jgi:hypothetical protein